MEQVGRVTPAGSEKLARLAGLIRDSPHNLVSRRAREELETRHIPECVAFAESLPEDSPVLDVGSGGGLPGLIIALIRPELQVHLLEATGKKAAFLISAAEVLGLTIDVHYGRAEGLASTGLAGSFPIVTARAVAPLERLIPWCEPFLSTTGELYAIKGDRWEEELDEAAVALSRLDLVVVHTPAATDEGDAVGRVGPKVVRIGRK